MDATKKAYQKLIRKTDELVISQFIARFGDPYRNPKGYPIIRIRDVTDVLTGATPNRNNSLYYAVNRRHRGGRNDSAVLFCPFCPFCPGVQAKSRLQLGLLPAMDGPVYIENNNLSFIFL